MANTFQLEGEVITQARAAYRDVALSSTLPIEQRKERARAAARIRWAMEKHGIRRGSIYLIRNQELRDHVKIGHSQNVQKRLTELQVANSCELVVITSIDLPNSFVAVRIETMLKRRYADAKLRGEWFKLTEADIEQVMEFLKVAQEQLARIRQPATKYMKRSYAKTLEQLDWLSINYLSHQRGVG